MDRDREVGRAIVTAAEEASAGVADVTRAQEVAYRAGMAGADVAALLSAIEQVRLHLARVAGEIDPLAATLSDDRYADGVAPVSTLIGEA